MPGFSPKSLLGLFFVFCFNIQRLLLKLELTTLARLADQIVSKLHGSFCLYGLVCPGVAVTSGSQASEI